METILPIIRQYNIRAYGFFTVYQFEYLNYSFYVTQKMNVEISDGPFKYMGNSFTWCSYVLIPENKYNKDYKDYNYKVHGDITYICCKLPFINDDKSEIELINTKVVGWDAMHYDSPDDVDVNWMINETKSMIDDMVE